jgi:predicted O-methyltransferase YrrM
LSTKEPAQELWTAVDEYLNAALLSADPILEAARAANAKAGLPDIAVAPNQGKLLYLLARIQGARNILEIGTLGGYSTIWLARALPPDGHLTTLEADPKHAELARANLIRAGFAEIVDLRLGKALDTLPELAAEGSEPFDLVFIDADKANMPGYFTWAIRLSRPGALLIFDNVIRDGRVIDAGSNDPNIQGVRRLNEMLAAEPRVSATCIQTVGSKGYDGFTLVLVNNQ